MVVKWFGQVLGSKNRDGRLTLACSKEFWLVCWTGGGGGGALGRVGWGYCGIAAGGNYQ